MREHRESTPMDLVRNYVDGMMTTFVIIRERSICLLQNEQRRERRSFAIVVTDEQEQRQRVIDLFSNVSLPSASKGFDEAH